MNENTLYDNVSNENTEYAGCEKCPVTPEEVAESKASVLNKKRDVKIVSGVVGGVLLGGLAFGLTSMDKEDAPTQRRLPIGLQMMMSRLRKMSRMKCHLMKHSKLREKK